MRKRFFGATILAVVCLAVGSGCRMCDQFFGPYRDSCNDPCAGNAPPPVVRPADPYQ